MQNARDEDNNLLKLTQLVLLQSYHDEFDLLNDGPDPRTPAEPGMVLMPCDEKDVLSWTQKTEYQSGVGKLLHMMRWSRPDILNATRELSRHMKKAANRHMMAMYCVMRYCVATPEQGLFLKPNGVWNGDKDYEFKIVGMSNAN